MFYSVHCDTHECVDFQARYNGNHEKQNFNPECLKCKKV